MAAPNQIGSGDLFDSYFRRADLDGDGHISGAEAVAFFQASNLPKNVLAQVWAYADSKKAGYLGRAEFYNALKLVTVAQSKRDLTPDIVKAALYGPASAKIPAPQINLATTPSPQPRPVTPANQAGGTTSTPSQTAWMGGSNLSGNAVKNQQYTPPQQNQFVRPQQTTTPTGSSQPTPNYPNHSTAMGVTIPTSHPQNTPMSSDWLSGRTSGSTRQVNAHVSNQLIDQSPDQNVLNRAGPGSISPLQPRPQVSPGQIGLMPLKPHDSAITSKPQEIAPKTPFSSVPSTQPVKTDSNTLTAFRNGFPSDSLFGDGFSATPSLPKQNSLGATSLVSSSSVSAGTVVSSAGPLASGKQTPAVSVQSTFSQHPVGSQNQYGESLGKPTQQFAPSMTASVSAGSHGGAGNSASNQLTQSQQLPWPKMTPADVQKYTKVFMQVDTDRDGKITGNQARNLFLSWRLPREVLKQVWDLSDQDNDSMLSLKEFCIALYLMERYREGRPLPPHFPSTVMPNENLFSLPGQPIAPSWGHSHGFQNQPQVSGASRPPSIPKGKPPRPIPVPHSDGAMHPQHKRKVPVLEKHLVDQLSKDEQESLNSKFQEATAVDKKVEELEKEIVESKQKIEFCRVKMQELVLYKSKCDNRFNEITERVSADKREVESLAKKYEEKFKQSGDVASKLSLEEATFRDIQEKKMELYQAIVKYEEGNPDDQAIKERGERIQSGLEELIKDLNERCKQYGLRGKPTSLVELPFGWQAGIQEAAADWDEDWDKLEDEGFTFVKELTLDVPNVVAPPREKSSVKRKEVDTLVKKESQISTPNSDLKETGEQIDEKGTDSEVLDAKSPTSPTRKNAEEKISQEDSDSVKNDIDASPHSKDTKSDHDLDGNKSTHSSKFDTHFDTDSVLGLSDNGKDNEKHYSDFGLGFGFEEFSIKPIRTSSSDTGIKFPAKPSLFSDSVPSTPADLGNIFAGKQTFFDESVPSTPANASDMFPGKKSFFDDSVPSTPAYAGIMFPEKKSAFDDSVPSTPAYAGIMFPEKKSAFDDSVPSTPAYGGGMSFPEKKSFFDDSVPSTPAYNFTDFGSKPFPEPSPFMFDSVPSTPAGKSSEDQSFNSFSRFDSFKSEADPFASRFDSFGAHRFDSFNSHSFDSSNQTQESGFGQSPRKSSLARFDSIGSSKDSSFDYSHGFGFDDADPFKTSKESQTPRSSDHWNAF